MLKNCILNREHGITFSRDHLSRSLCLVEIKLQRTVVVPRRSGTINKTRVQGRILQGTLSIFFTLRRTLLTPHTYLRTYILHCKDLFIPSFTDFLFYSRQERNLHVLRKKFRRLGTYRISVAIWISFHILLSHRY